MPQTTVRFPDDLLERIEEDSGPETSRSEWLRQAARERLNDDRDDLDQLRTELDLLTERVDELEANRSLLTRLLS